MWNALFGQRNLYSKCKAALKMINWRMQNIMKKRNAMQKFLKNDIADLLRSNLDYNAYGRAEGLYIELSLSSCYIYVEECCKNVSDHLKAIHMESECPQECRIAVASLMHAASRFSDLLELRDVRTMFTEKYGNELDMYVSKEFIEKLKANPPTMEMKFQLMRDISKEFSIAWDPTSLEHFLNDPSPQQDRYHTSGYKLNRAMSDDVLSKKEARRGWDKVIPTPDVNPTIDGNENKPNQEEVKPPKRPNSVRSKYIKRPENGQQHTNYNDVNSLEVNGECDQEAMMDRLLIHYSTKPSRTNCTNGAEKAKDLGSEGCTIYRSKSDSLYMNHLHPKLPDYDELASRMEALRKT